MRTLCPLASFVYKRLPRLGPGTLGVDYPPGGFGPHCTVALCPTMPLESHGDADELHRPKKKSSFLFPIALPRIAIPELWLPRTTEWPLKSVVCFEDRKDDSLFHPSQVSVFRDSVPKRESNAWPGRKMRAHRVRCVNVSSLAVSPSGHFASRGFELVTCATGVACPGQLA